MKYLALGLFALSLGSVAALAGPNNGGVLILALSEGTVYCTDVADYCGSATAVDCDDAVGRWDSTDTIILNVLAVFPIGYGAAPRLAGTTFGIEYDDFDVALSDFGPCGDFELATSDWPSSGEGTAVTWSIAEEEGTTEVYWFAAYNYYGTAQLLSLIGHPTQGAYFADDSVPSELDPIVELGSFGFNTEGDVPCFAEGTPGACCLPSGDCIDNLLFESCEEIGGEFWGDGSACDDMPCEGILGACCFSDGQCELLNLEQCEDGGGEYQGDDVPCDDTLCDDPTPAQESSWGQIKARLR